MARRTRHTGNPYKHRKSKKWRGHAKRYLYDWMNVYNFLLSLDEEERGYRVRMRLKLASSTPVGNSEAALRRALEYIAKADPVIKEVLQET